MVRERFFIPLVEPFLHKTAERRDLRTVLPTSRAKGLVQLGLVIQNQRLGLDSAWACLGSVSSLKFLAQLDLVGSA